MFLWITRKWIITLLVDDVGIIQFGLVPKKDK